MEQPQARLANGAIALEYDGTMVLLMAELQQSNNNDNNMCTIKTSDDMKMNVMLPAGENVYDMKFMQIKGTYNKSNNTITAERISRANDTFHMGNYDRLVRKAQQFDNLFTT